MRFSAGVIASGGVGVPAVAYLPTVSASPSAAYGMRVLVTGYNGALFQVQRASDNATMDVVQTTNGLPNNASIVTWASGSETRISTVYDQTGNSRHATQATFANMPLYDAAGLYGASTAFNVFKAMVVDGYYTTVNFPKQLNIPTSVTFARNNFSLFMLIEPKQALYNDLYFDLINGATSFHNIVTATSVSGLQGSGGTTVFSGRRPRQQYQVIGCTSGASAYKFLQDDQIISTTAKSTATVLGGIIGAGIANSASFLSGDNFLGFILYPVALSDSDATSVVGALKSNFGIATLDSNQLVMVGDSILVGGTPNLGIQNRTTSRKLRALLKGNPAQYNMGVPSQTLTLLNTSKASREFILATDGSYAKRVLVIQIGTNDLGSNGSTVGYGATLYSNLTSYIASARTAGFTFILVCTLLPRSNTPDWQSQASQYWTEMNDYNTRVRNNAAGADGVIDLAADPVMGSFANTSNTTYYEDALHPTGLGYELLAPIYAAGINAIL